MALNYHHYEFSVVKFTSIFLSFRLSIYRYAREFPDPYLGHGIGPVPGYGVSVDRIGSPINDLHYHISIFFHFSDGHVSRKLQSLYAILISQRSHTLKLKNRTKCLQITFHSIGISLKGLSKN